MTGRLSMKASRSASSYTMLAGALPATIAQKMQSSAPYRVQIPADQVEASSIVSCYLSAVQMGSG